mmetsp:Transcript_94033/g.196202  ORF Transcript_94033/g.196202 Transcript_94033/m.196202 type:complete len:212 (+) Transcript_94033:64-699(+)
MAGAQAVGASLRPPAAGLGESRRPSAYLLLAGESPGEPIQALVEAVAGGGAGALDEPLSMTQIVKAQFLGDFCCSHGIGQVLLVGEHQEDSVAHLVLVEHLVQLLPGVLDAVAIVAVDDVDEAVGALVVVPPERADLVLATDVPDSEAQVLVLDGLNVEADGGDGRDDLTQLQFVKDGSLTGGIQPDHQDAHLLLADQSLPNLREGQTHLE